MSATYIVKSDATGWSLWLSGAYRGHVRHFAKAVQLTGGNYKLWR